MPDGRSLTCGPNTTFELTLEGDQEGLIRRGWIRIRQVLQVPGSRVYQSPNVAFAARGTDFFVVVNKNETRLMFRTGAEEIVSETAQCSDVNLRVEANEQVMINASGDVSEKTPSTKSNSGNCGTCGVDPVQKSGNNWYF